MSAGSWLELSDDERQLFLAEGADLLEQLEAGLLELEAGRGGPETVHAVFRAAHTLKGSAATVGLEGMARLTHAMESRLDAWRHGQGAPQAGEIATMLAAVDRLREMLAAVAAGGDPPPPPAALLATLEAPSAAPADAWVIEAELDPGCPMPAVRALQVLLALEDRAPLLSSEPSRDGLEATWSGRSVRAWVAGGASAADLESTVAAVPDVVAVRVRRASGDDAPRGGPADGGAASEARPAATVAAGAAAAAARAGATTDATTAALAPPAAPASDAQSGSPTERNRPGPAGGRATSPHAPVADGSAPRPADPGAGRTASGIPAAGATAAATDDRTIRVDVALLDRLLNLVGELVVERSRLAQLGQELARRSGAPEVADELFRVNVQIARITGALQDAVLQARMLPVARLFRRFPRLVRDLALMLGKQVELELVGEDTELDRTLHQVVADPLLHLVRNALDHGIESPDERRRAGKPPTGRLRLAAAREGHHVLIRVEDDGRGIDPQRLRQAAVAKGLITPERAAALGDREALDLMFLPGFSTAERVTGVSGRGVGLDVVRQQLEQAGGRVEVDTRPGAGTTFTLVLPLTLATLRALLVGVQGHLYALPLADVGEVVRVDPDALRSVQGRWATTVRGQVVPLLWLRQFGDPRFRPQPAGEPLVAVLVEHQGQPVGLVVDRLLGEQEVVVKGLGELLAGTRGLSGATILGDGRLALILDTPALVTELAFGGPAALSHPGTGVPGRPAPLARRVASVGEHPEAPSHPAIAAAGRIGEAGSP